MSTQTLKQLSATTLGAVGAVAAVAALSRAGAGEWAGLVMALPLGGALGAMLWERYTSREHIREKLTTLGAQSSGVTLSVELNTLLREVERLLSALAPEGAHAKESTADDVSRALERLATRAYRLLSAESVELALFDREAGAYRSSFVLGKPFRQSSQAMLSGVMEDTVEVQFSSDVMVAPILFCGNTLGSFRIALRQGETPTEADKRIVTMLSAQASMIIINSRFSEELIRMRRSSEESVRAKTGFLANLSHEIRGPLGIVLNANELLLEGLCGEINADQRETLVMIQKNGRHLLELINDVLDYAKSEAGAMKVEASPQNLNEILADITNVVRSQADAKGHTLRFTKGGDETLAAICDRRHLRQMLINLLTNAIKYTPPGGEITLWAEAAAAGAVTISVKDTGVGIAPENHHKVFAAFERIEEAYSREQLGTGIGMPLTLRLAQANGGTVTFESAVGKGTTFKLSLPRGSRAPDDVIETATPSSEKVVDGTALLLIEWDESERAVNARYLAHAGFLVIPTGSLKDALVLGQRSRVDLVLVDDRTVGEDPHRFVAELRKQIPSSTPIVLSSGRAFTFETERYLKAGIDRCIAKPIELAQLARALADAVRPASRTRD